MNEIWKDKGGSRLKQLKAKWIWNEHVREKSTPHYDKEKLPFIVCLLLTYSKKCTKQFVSITLFNPHTNLVRLAVWETPFYWWETKDQRGEVIFPGWQFSSGRTRSLVPCFWLTRKDDNVLKRGYSEEFGISYGFCSHWDYQFMWINFPHKILNKCDT